MRICVPLCAPTIVSTRATRATIDVLRRFHIGYSVISIPHRTLAPVVSSPCRSVIVSKLDDHVVPSFAQVCYLGETAFLREGASRATTESFIDDWNGDELVEVLSPSCGC